jgi:phytoene desaturase
MAAYRIIIIGAGPAGLTSAMILAYRGYDVIVLEKEREPGGRNKAIHLGPYTFDTGPTFLMMPFVLNEVFELAGKSRDDYLNIVKLDPIYRLSFKNSYIDHFANRERLFKEIAFHYPGDELGLRTFYRNERVRYEHMYACLKRPYSSVFSLLATPLIKALPYLSIGKSLHQVLNSYFKNDDLIISFTFQSKYLGMSPWECPGAFGLIPFVEHEYGIYHVMGGLSNISLAMEKVGRQNGVQYRYNTPVDHVACNCRKAKGVVLKTGEFLPADAVIINADFGHAMENFFKPGVIRKWTPDNLRKKVYSCSTFMLYLGLDTVYNEPHHNILFAKDYRRNVEDIVKRYTVSDDFSLYVRNASRTDSSLAPPKHSALYVLVPVPNRKSSIEWNDIESRLFRNKIVDKIKERTSMIDIDKHIVTEKIITPRDWELEHSLFLGATFNLGHSLNQMLYFRPHNQFEEVNSCYIVGGGTHPGSGLPTIYESARISSDLITRNLPIGKGAVR